MRQVIRGRPEGAAVEIWYQDEARVGQQGTDSRLWAPVGSRPEMIRDNGRQSAWLFGAICPDRGTAAALVLPVVNTKMMNLHLQEISTQVGPGAVAVLICDGAAWHQRSTTLTVPDNIRLLPLPPYSPQLNPMENVWSYLRQNRFCGVVWDTYQDIVTACSHAWSWFVSQTERITSIGTRSWTQVNI